MRPKPIPLLSEEQFKAIQKEIERQPSKEDIQRIKRAKEVLKAHHV